MAESYTSRTACRRGITLYYTVVFGSILLIVGASMLNLSLKEFALSSLIRDSEYAFYAADSGTECALYWDLIGVYTNSTYYSGFVPAFQVTNTNDVTSPYYVDPTKRLEIRCNGDNQVSFGWPYSSPALIAVESSGSGAVTTFYYNVGSNPQYCVMVRVIKGLVVDNSATPPETTINTSIDARGYNVPCGVNDVNKIERAIRTDYPREYN